MMAIAFSPAHITGFFQIFIDDDARKSGSVGAGISIGLGSYALVKKSKTMRISKKAAVARDAIKRFGSNFEVKIWNDLPISQGFGISGSSALAAAMAACQIEGLPLSKALEFAHVAEVENRTGLGDVIAAFHGGMEARLKPGIYGKIKKWVIDEKLLILVASLPLRTKSIITDEKMVKRINEIGEECIKEFLAKPTFDRFLDLSKKFSEESGILNKKMLEILKDLNNTGKTAACMIGNSFFTRYSRRMKKKMVKYGRVYEAEVDNTGARILALIK